MAAAGAEIMFVLRVGRVTVRLVDGRLLARHLDGELPEGPVGFIQRFRDTIVAERQGQERKGAD